MGKRERDKNLYPDEWIKKGVNFKDKKNPLYDQAIVHDRWDDEDLKHIVKEVPPFTASRRKLGEFTETGEPAMNDMFWTLLKAEPELQDPGRVRPTHLINHLVAKQAMDLDETRRLRRFSVNDDVQAGMSCHAMEPELENIFDQTDQQIEKAKEFEQKLQELFDANQEATDLDEMVERWKDENDPDGEGGLSDEQQAEIDQMMKDAAEAADKAAQAQEAAAQAGDEFSEQAGQGQGTMRNQLAKAMNKAADEAQENMQNAQAWGLEPGEVQHLNAQQRMDLAKKLNDPRFKKIAQLFGPMKNLMLSEQQRKTTHTPEEVFDIGIGNDLGRMLPEELLALSEERDEDDPDAEIPPQEIDFYRRFAEGKLLQYEMNGVDRLAQGGIIYCEDGSGSMSGERELWSKAVMLCLLHIARKQNRTMHVVHFGSRNQFKTLSFVRPEDFKLERIIEAAELFFSGGTDFQTPMNEALRILREEFNATGGVKADVVFTTDDECHVPEAFMEEFLSEMARMQSTTWGISVSGRQPSKTGALYEMSQGKVATIKDFLSGKDVSQIFRAV